MSITCLPSGIQRSITSRKPFGGSGSLRKASSLPISRRLSTESAPMPSATRCGVPNRLPSTGMVWPVGRSNSSAGPPAEHAVADLGHLEARVDLARTRFSSPAASSWAMKSRRSR